MINILYTLKSKKLPIPDKTSRLIEINEDYEDSCDQIEIVIHENESDGENYDKTKIPEINKYSDKMLEYEMNRFIGERK